MIGVRRHSGNCSEKAAEMAAANTRGENAYWRRAGRQRGKNGVVRW